MLWVDRRENDADRTVDLKQPSAAEQDAYYMRRGSSPKPAAEIHFHQLTSLLWRRRSLVLSIAATGTMMAAVVGLLIPPKYTAVAQLIVQPPAGMLNERPLDAATMDQSIDTHVTLLGSRDHLRRVIESLSKDSDSPARTDSPPKGEATAASSYDARRSVIADEPAAATATETTPLNEFKHHLILWINELRPSGKTDVPSLEEFERKAQVNQERRSRIISVAFTSASPKKAAAFANRIVQRYVDDLINQKAASANGETARLEGRIAEVKYEMESAELAMETAVQQRWGSEQSGNNEGRNNNGHLHELERQVGTAVQLYNSLLQRQKAMREREETVSPGIEIHALASVPHRPSSLNPILFIFPAFVVFAIAGSWLAIVLEQLDRGLRSAREISEALGIGCIGLVPLLAARFVARPDQYLGKKSFSPYTEAIRSAAATLQLARCDPASKVVLITSSVPREGKTTLALSLAACVAQLGRSVLLLDLDFRQRSPFGGFIITSEGPVAVPRLQKPPTAQAIQRVAEVGFDYLPMPRSRFDALASFSGEQISSFMRQLRERYDCVIIDGPPLLGVAEARLLPSIADKLLFVVKWGSTRRDIVQNALNLVRDTCSAEENWNGRQFAIVTQVNLEKHAQYQYGDVAECLVRHNKYFNHFIEA